MRAIARRTALSLPTLCVLACVAADDPRADPSAYDDDRNIFRAPVIAATTATLAKLPASADIAERLRGLPGVANLREVGLGGGDARSFTFTIEQPIDHMHPEVGSFAIRAQLRHRSETAPTVLSSTGYSLFSPSPSDSEPSYLLSANAVSVEHRFFGPSTPLVGADGEPSPDAWTYMTVKQAADDNHHLIEVLKQVYTGPWLSTGASKGGQTSVFHYRFYPQDLVGVVAYVAPQSYTSDDPRYVRFLEHVGEPSCRDKLLAVQRDALMRRSEVFPRFQSQASSQGLTFEATGIEPAFEHVVQEFRFAFWQYGKPEDCNSLPSQGASAASLFSAIADRVPVDLGADQNIRSTKAFATYYYQAAIELGQYGPLEQHLEDLIQHPGTYTMEKYAPQVPSLKWNPATLIDIGQWVKTQAEHIIFVYGENDPWTAGAFELDPARDMHAFVVPQGNHGAQLTDRALPAESRALALHVLERWTGVKPRSLDSMPRPQPGDEPLFVQLPPRNLRR